MSAETIGWAVFGKHIDRAALYNLSEREKAFDAVKRWSNVSIIALVAHPDSPEISHALPSAWLLERGQPEGQVPTLWWCLPGKGDYKYGERWTENANEAHRFASWSAAYKPYDAGGLARDADAPVDGDGRAYLCHPTEHVWLDACNAHDELVAALREIELVLHPDADERSPLVRGTRECGEVIQNIVNAARAALAKVTP